MYLGIDIGKTGAIGVLGKDGQYITVLDLPSTSFLIGKGEKSKPSYRLNTAIIRQHFQGVPITACTMESVWGRDSNGCHANFSIGRYLGAMEVCLDALCWAGHEPCVQYVPPATWKKSLGLLKQGKGASLEKARALFPEATDRLKRKKDHNRAEALLIARYGWEMRRKNDHGDYVDALPQTPAL